MILEEGTDEAGKYYWAGLIERYALTLENYAGSDWGSRFYSYEFLGGFCERRNEIHQQVNRGTAGLIAATTALAFFDSIQDTASA